MKKIILWGVILIFLMFTSSASVVINQVLYNPEKTESGGEAIELYNNGNSDADISLWKIATEASSTDATIPENTILCPGCYYLIADEGWNQSKDNSSWRNADHEELINLYNTDSGVALMDDEDIIDAVGWGEAMNIAEGLFEGLPSKNVEDGKSLIRINDTDNNFDDFNEIQADFTGLESYSAATDIEFEIEEENKIVSITMSPLKIDFGRINTEEEYEEDIIVKNTGNVEVDLNIKCTEFEDDVNKLSSESVSYSVGGNYVNCTSSAKTIIQGLEPEAEISINIILNTPKESLTGKYAGKIMVNAIETE